MVKFMKKKILSILLCVTIMFILMATTAYADIGPKPSVIIDFKGLKNESYYVTLLSEIPSTGPHSVLGEDPDNQRYYEGDQEFEVWEKFVSYEDVNGYYFLQYFNDCTDTSQFVWGYYPPPKFKILLYFPGKDSYVVSTEIYEQYAFDSYYIVDAKDLNIQSTSYYNGGIKVEKDYDYTWEIISLFARIIATVIIEVFIALFFGFRAKKQIFIIGGVNIVTQSILNILLNIINYNQGSMSFVFNYVWMELLVFVIEAVIYSAYLNKYSGKNLAKKWVAPLYALIANAVSFGIGFYIAYLIPGIF